MTVLLVFGVNGLTQLIRINPLQLPLKMDLVLVPSLVLLTNTFSLQTIVQILVHLELRPIKTVFVKPIMVLLVVVMPTQMLVITVLIAQDNVLLVHLLLPLIHIVVPLVM